MKIFGYQLKNYPEADQEEESKLSGKIPTKNHDLIRCYQIEETELLEEQVEGLNQNRYVRVTVVSKRPIIVREPKIAEMLVRIDKRVLKLRVEEVPATLPASQFSEGTQLILLHPQKYFANDYQQCIKISNLKKSVVRVEDEQGIDSSNN